MATAAIISGAAGLLGGMQRNRGSAEQAAEANRFSAEMSSTAYQRATADMKAAGINPMMAYAQGGASAPSGQQADVTDVLSPAVSSAMQATRLDSDLKTANELRGKIWEEREKTAQDHQLSAANTIVAQEMAERVRAETERARQETARSAADTRSIELDNQGVEADLERRKNRSAAEKDIGKYAAYLDRLTESIGGIWGGSSAASRALRNRDRR